MNNGEMSQYLGVFLEEANEQLDLFESHVLGLEKSSDPDAELQVLFRAAHTIKGSSRAMGFNLIGELTHDMESVLDLLRGHQLKLSTPVIDVLLESLDCLKAMLELVAGSGSEDSADSNLVQRLVKSLRSFQGGEVAVEEEQAPEPEALTVDAGVIRLKVTIAADCPMKGIRALLVLGAIQKQVEVRGTSPSAEDLSDDKIGNSFEVAIDAAALTDGLLDTVKSLVDVTGVEVVKEEAKAEEKVAAATTKQSATVRVDVSRLDKLLNLVGEQVTDRTQLLTLAARLQSRYPDDEDLGALVEGVGRMGRITSELQEEIMKSRMLPINGVFQRMPRMVRDLAQKLGKDLELEVVGGETELDRSVLEVLGDPLIHLLRNSVDHGIESPEDRKKAGKPATGKVVLSARQERSQILVEVEDDGRGIDPVTIKAAAVAKGVISESLADSMSDREAMNLLFAPGLSTAKTLSDVSGRGVGMDIVRSNIEKIGGSIHVESKPGQGSRFQVFLPLTLAIVRAVLVRAAGCTYALPLTSVTEMISLETADGEITRCSAAGQAAIMLRGQTMPVANFADLLRGDPRAVDPGRVDENAYAVIVRHGDGQTALSVDELQGELEVVIKPLGSMLKEVAGVSGASILGDGQVALVVDPSKVLSDMFRGVAAA